MPDTDVKRLCERLRSNAELTLCPFDVRAPKNDLGPYDPCPLCGCLGTLEAKNQCKGADTRDFAAAADRLESQAAEIELLREADATLHFIAPALPVLRTMLDKAGLNLGVAKADEMLAAINAYLAIEQHDWFVPDSIGYECCRKCGIVRRADDKNGPCRGLVSVTLRDARAERAESHAAALAEALKPLARLEVPLRPQGNAGAYSIYHDSIRAARAALNAYRSASEGAEG